VSDVIIIGEEMLSTSASEAVRAGASFDGRFLPTAKRGFTYHISMSSFFCLLFPRSENGRRRRKQTRFWQGRQGKETREIILLHYRNVSKNKGKIGICTYVLNGRNPTSPFLSLEKRGERRSSVEIEVSDDSAVLSLVHESV
jgi:hypothetical protein